MIAMDFPTQDAYDKYMKEHPDADKSKHKVVKQEESKKEIEKKIKETPDEVEERLKKQMGDKYKTQDQRIQEGKKDMESRSRTLQEMKGGLGQWVKDYKEQRKSNPEAAKKTKENIDKAIKEKGLHKDLVYGKVAQELLKLAKSLAESL
jgi:hypothetical protein